MKTENWQNIKTSPEQTQSLKDCLEILNDNISLYARKLIHELEEQKDDFAISFLESIKDYERESGNCICDDERSFKELLEIFKNQNL
jgi:hypothetical protein